MIKGFEEINKDDLHLVGGKGLSLGNMLKAELPVPNGFVVTTEAYDAYKDSGLDKSIESRLLEAFDRLNTQLVSVRSSATAEDSEAASWAGQLETYLNVDKTHLIEAIQNCWKSADSTRAARYAAEQKIDLSDLKVAVIVQAMIASEASGVMFTANPLTGRRDEVMIEAAYGLGEMVVQGEVNPDNYVVTKDLQIVVKTINDKEQMMVRKNNSNEIVTVPADMRNKQVLEDKKIQELTHLGSRIERYYEAPQDIEWALQGTKLYILQSRPITTLKEASVEKAEEINGEVITSGIGASAGLATGTARLINELSDLKDVQNGEILLAHKTTPDFVEAFSKVKGVATESGGATCHAAIVSRELGIPAVVGTGDVLLRAKTGDRITIDGTSGLVYAGEVRHVSDAAEEFVMPQPSNNDIQDMIDSITIGVNDSNELWPIGPVRLMTYIDVDQSIDMYEKLKQLKAEGKSDHDIAALFERPVFIKTFLLNTGIVGIKGANVYVKKLKLEDQIKFVEWMLAILKILNQGDDNYIVSRNYLWTSDKANEYADTSEWSKANSETAKALNILSINLLALNWALYWDYFPETGHELHGPYQVNKFGPGSRMVVKDYFNMSPGEVWESAKDFPYSTVQLAQIYDTDKMYINFGNRMIGDNLAAHNTHFNLLVNGQNITKLEEIQELSNSLKELADKQAKYVTNLEPMEIVRKGAKITYFARKKFYQHFSKDWYPEEMVEGTIKALGREFIDKPDATQPMSMKEKREMWDPRNEILP